MKKDEGNIRNDFHKLLQAEAKYKIMVFQWNSSCKDKDEAKKRSEDRINNIFTQLEETVKCYESKSAAKYLIFGWSAPAKEFMYSQFEVRNYIDEDTIQRGNLHNSKAT
jgi:hypothetical protein